MRERLIELIIQSVDGCARNWAETIANYLLENGVVILPCKVGDTLYFPSISSNKIFEVTVSSFRIKENGNRIYCGYCYFLFEDVGKKVFITKKEAEKHLKGVEQNDKL